MSARNCHDQPPKTFFGTYQACMVNRDALQKEHLLSVSVYIYIYSTYIHVHTHVFIICMSINKHMQIQTSTSSCISISYMLCVIYSLHIAQTKVPLMSCSFHIQDGSCSCQSCWNICPAYQICPVNGTCRLVDKTCHNGLWIATIPCTLNRYEQYPHTIINQQGF